MIGQSVSVRPEAEAALGLGLEWVDEVQVLVI
jgi:hypothetical protein